MGDSPTSSLKRAAKAERDMATSSASEATVHALLTFAEAVEEISKVTGHKVVYNQISNEAFTAAMAKEGVPEDAVALMSYLFTTVLDGRNERLSDGIQRALGRQPRDFTNYAQEAAAAGAWQEGSVGHG
jgi:uncharacterized protein YbjT (DUF2867 family)